MSVRVRLPLNPMPAPRPRVTSRGWAYFPKRYKQWREDAAALIPGLLTECGLKAPLDGALGISVDFAVAQPKTTKLLFPKGDIDNFLKILDCFNGLLWEDDYQIINVEAAKRWAPKGRPGHVDILVKNLGRWR